MSEGALVVDAPQAAASRAAGQWLTGATPLAPGARRRVDLKEMTTKLVRVAPGVTPGMIAAHAVGRRLGVKVHARARQTRERQLIHESVVAGIGALPVHVRAHLDADGALEYLRSSRWLGRLEKLPDWDLLVSSVFAILAELPVDDSLRDRRLIAAALGSPHALDEGTRTSGLAQALLVGGGWVPGGLGYRATWEFVGIRSDDVIGGLSCLGVLPAGWFIPSGAVVTIPPRELAHITWSVPTTAGQVLYVTENPSILTAAAERLGATSSAVICINGTPAARELEALAKLPQAGWRVAVRADFDIAGLRHVTGVLATVPGAAPWRMSLADYERSISLTGADPLASLTKNVRDVAWAPGLAAAMRTRGQAAYEETIVEDLLDDIANNRT